MADPRRYVVIGGGILGLAVAERLTRRPEARVSVLEKEADWARHQTGRNSGVVHSGVYYTPGGHKALMCRRGSASIVEFARRHGVPVDVCGKLIVATRADELPRLAALADRGRRNGLAVRELGPDQAREIEPYVSCLRAVQVPTTGIIDYRGVTLALAGLVAERGGELRLSTAVTGFHSGPRSTTVVTTGGDVEADVVVNCAGLQSDRIARLAGDRPPARIVPFRGEYYELRREAAHLVRGLIYPVPDPAFPFLGVHLTRTTSGGVHAGPNAVLALAREGYDWRRVRPGDVADTLRYPGFWRLARRHLAAGVEELRRSLSRRRFADSLRRLVPDVSDDDLVPAPAGVRAQALAPDGSLVDDFLITRHDRTVHVLNAPSPAATCALEIAAHIESLLA